jgi:hypothetical protein
MWQRNSNSAEVESHQSSPAHVQSTSAFQCVCYEQVLRGRNALLCGAFNPTSQDPHTLHSQQLDEKTWVLFVVCMLGELTLCAA